MIISRSAHKQAPNTPWPVSWPELAAALVAPPRVQPTKGGPLWSPAERDPDAPNGREEHVRAVHVAVFDLDGLPSAALAAQVALVRDAGLAAVIHPTWGCAAAHPLLKWRLVVPLAAPVPRAGWKATWERLRAWLAPETDTACKDAGHRYFLPGSPDGRAAFAPLVLDGAPLDVAAVPPAAELAPEQPRRRAKLDDLRDTVDLWRTNRDPSRKRLTRALRSVVAGEPYAEAGTIDTTTFQLVSDVMLAQQDLDPATVPPLFWPSLSLMGAEPGYLAKIEDMARRALERHAANAIALPSGPPPTEPLLLVTPAGSTYYTLNCTDWKGPWSGDAVDRAIETYLAGKVPLWRQTDKGQRRVSKAEILSRYGREILTHRIVLGAASSSFDAETGTFREAGAALRPLTPSFSPTVDEYLRRLTNDDAKAYRDVNTWLTHLPDLSRPLAALVLIGRKGAGKSLFAEAAARLWADYPTAEIEAAGAWTQAVLTCPLVFADEHISSDTTKLRAMIQARSVVVTRKYLPSTVADGCLRFVVALNDDHALAFNERYGLEDLRALYERLYIVRITGRSVAFAAEHAGRIKAELAPHALWLAEHHPKSTQRFGIEGTKQQLLKISTRGGVRSDLLQWIVGALRAPVPCIGAPWSGRLCIDPILAPPSVGICLQEVLRLWSQYLDQAARPKVQDLRLAASTLGTVRHTRFGNTWLVPAETIQTWIEDTGWSVPPAVEMIAKALDNVRSVGKVAN